MSQTNITVFKKIIQFPITKMIIGFLVIGGCVALVEWEGRSLLNQTQLSDDLKNFIVGLTEALLALLSYILLYKFYEKRKIKELNLTFVWKDALFGFLTGLILQSLFIFIIYLAGGYSIVRINPVSFLLPACSTALTAGFVGEILIRGIAFRLTEEKLGTAITLIIFAVLFAIFHLGAKGATLLSVPASAIQAGLLLSSAYVLTRRLWFPIFLHFAWDFAEPGIYGAINPGISVDKSLFTSKITGSWLLTGGEPGPQNSLQSVIFCLATSLIFLWLAKRKNNFIQPYWKK
jgi:membrane protease YdiL (CAAX protease family)